MTGLAPYFTQSPVLAALPHETQQRLERIAEHRQYRRRQVIHFPDQRGDFVYLLCTGRVKVSRVSEHGREVTLYLLDDVQLFGETGLLEENQQYELMAETADDCLVAVLRRSDFLPSVLASHTASLELMKLIASRRTLAEAAVGDLVFLEVPKRIAKLLLHLSEQCCRPHGRGGTVLPTKYTHQELANMIGSTRETTTLILNDFKRHGMIDFLGRKIIVQEREELEAVLRRNSAAK